MKKSNAKDIQIPLLTNIIVSCLTIFETANASQIETLAKLRAPASATKACVLYYERTEHPFWKQVQKIFNSHPEVVLIENAKPVDLVKCVLQHNPQEILIFSHSFEIDSETTKLGFFLPLNEEETVKNYRKTLVALRAQHKKIVSNANFTLCNTNSERSDPCTPAQNEEMKIRSTLGKLSAMKKTDATYKLIFGYEKGLFLQKSFEDLYSLVKTSNLALRKIRLMSCEPQKVFNAYPALKRIVQEQGITLDIAPKNHILSFLNNKQITTFDRAWLKKSLKGNE
jgi:hypothetical protein